MGRYWPRSREVGPDLSAAVTVALVSVAEGIAYAVVAGVDPIYGLYSGSVSVVIGSLLSSTSLLMVTATNALALVTADKIGALGDGVDPASAMFTLTLLIGVVMAVAGLLRLGSLVRFLSAEVQAGLVAAVALLILLGQYKDLVGYASASDGNKVVKAVDITAHIGSWDWPTVAVGVGCIVLLVVVKRTSWRSFADVVAMVAGTAAVWALSLDSVATIGDLSSIPSGLASLPTPHLPELSLVPALLPAAAAAAIVGLSEAATVGVAFPNPDGRRSDSSRDFLAQGAANIVGGLFRAMPAAGSLSRTGVNASAGGRSRWSGVYAGVLLMLVVAVAAPLAERIPMATLAAILIVIGFDTLVRELRHLAQARWVSRPHLVAGGITVVVGVFDELTTAVFVGVGLSLLLFTLTMADRSRLVAWEPTADGRWEETDPPAALTPGTVTVLARTGSLYFASTYSLSQDMPDHASDRGAAVVLQIRDRRFYSLTGLDYLAELITRLREHGHVVVLADVEPSQRVPLERSGLLATIGPANVVWRHAVLGEAATLAVHRAEQLLAEQSAPVEHPGGPATPDADN